MRVISTLRSRVSAAAAATIAMVAVVTIALAPSTAGAQTTTTTGTTSAGTTGAGKGPLDKVTVTAAAGAGDTAPTLKFAKPLAVKSSTYKILTEGTGEQPTAGAKVAVDYVEVDGRTGKTIGSSYGANLQSLTLDKTASLGVIVNVLLASRTGGQALVAISPKDAKKLQGSGSSVKKSDTLVFLLTLDSVRHPLSRATGAATTPPGGLPTVTLDAAGKPTIAMPAGVAASSSLVVQPLVVGTGPVVAAG